MGYCGEYTAVKHEEVATVAVSLRCRSWNCIHCQPTRKSGLIANAIGGVPNKMLTLTHRASAEFTPEQAAKRLSWAWRICRKRLMRKHKWKSLPFLAVVEKHKSGWPHLHILLRTPFIPWVEIRDIMKELIDSPRVRIEQISKFSKVCGYCAKYCGKAVEKFQSAKRYWQSRDYDLRDDDEKPDYQKEKGGWEILSTPLQLLVLYREEQGYDIQWMSASKALFSRARAGPS